MGISLQVVSASEDEIERLRHEARPLALLPGLRERANASLLGYWRPLHALLVARGGDALPWCALARGEVEFGAAEDPTHAVGAASTRRLAAALAELSRDE